MGKPIREFESRPLRKQKGDTKSVALIVCRKPSSACGRKADGEQLGGLAEQRPFVCRDARGSAEISNLAPALAFTRMKTDEKKTLRSKGLFLFARTPAAAQRYAISPSPQKSERQSESVTYKKKLLIFAFKSGQKRD